LVTDEKLSAADAFTALRALRHADDMAERNKNIRRTITTGAVIGLHVLLVILLIISQRMPRVPHIKLPVEITLRLLPLPQTANVPVIVANPEKKKKNEEVIDLHTSPITLPPPAPSQKEQPVDIMRALGIALACGASHYEYLSPAEKKLCRHPPWTLPPDRALVSLPKPLPPPPGLMTGAEAAARERQTAAPCPILQNTPCIDEVIYGKGGHELHR
jgi:hypothetical protein